MGPIPTGPVLPMSAVFCLNRAQSVQKIPSTATVRNTDTHNNQCVCACRWGWGRVWKKGSCWSLREHCSETCLALLDTEVLPSFTLRKGGEDGATPIPQKQQLACGWKHSLFPRPNPTPPHYLLWDLGHILQPLQAPSVRWERVNQWSYIF
jgi:hypothetical protein